MEEFKLTLKVQVTIEAPTEFDAYETVKDIFGDAPGIIVNDIDIKRTPKPRKKK